MKTNKDYDRARELGLTHLNRWEDGIDHHPMSDRLVRFLADHDYNDYGDYFYWKVGGDGDNGETLMYEIDAFFEMLDIDEPNKLKMPDQIDALKKDLEACIKLCKYKEEQIMKERNRREKAERTLKRNGIPLKLNGIL